MRKNIVLLLTFFWILSGTLAQFTNVNEETGVRHQHFTETVMGGGALFIDYNNDGWLDLYLTGGRNPDKLYQNNSDGTFTDVSEGSFVQFYTKDTYTFGVSAGDINNDGCMDIFIASFKKDEKGILLRNNCNGTFTNISKSAGIEETSGSTHGIFLDYNNDSFLDLYVINYIDEFDFIHDQNGIIVDIDHSCLPNHFYINNGDETFSEVAKSYKLNDDGCGLAVQATDYDQDGDQDIYIANDHGYFVNPNILYENQYPSEAFTRREDTGLNVGFYAMGIASSDYDNDGDFDYYITNLGDNAFLINEDGTYVDKAEEFGIQNGVYEDDSFITGWGTNFFDADLDGDEDLFVSNGYIPTGYFGITTKFEDDNKFYLNVSGEEFVESTEEWGLSSNFVNRGSAVGDYDNDGDLDLVVMTAGNDDQHTILYRNDQSTKNNYVNILLEGLKNPDAYGTIVKVYSGDFVWLREKYSGSSHASQSSGILNVGLGDISIIDSIVVKWPGGSSQVYKDLPSNETLYFKESADSYKIAGCMNSSSSNYNSKATKDYGCFYQVVMGCSIVDDINFDSKVTTIDNSCISEPIVILSVGKRPLIDVYPNPTEGVISIRVPENNIHNGYLAIFDTMGKLVLSNVLEKQINISKLKSGVYVMKMVIGEEEFDFRIIKK